MKKVFTIPNIISMFRILLIPIFCVLYFSSLDKGYIYAFAVIILSAASDIIDGFIARRFNMISDVGKVLDPFADKLTQVVVAVCLAFNHKMLLPVLSVLATKELLTGVAATLWLKNGLEPISARWWGKVSTALLYASFIYYVICDIFMFNNHVVDIVFTVLTIAFLLFSMCGYIRVFIYKPQNLED
ncbi:MAG: CDP-alcohol phosphatidyltransferase family protein [Acutalibacteraceae bacterium]|nr:CDP-alcohol phosphatidyltransferase family protein [Acutalibacteraceae bacterium]